MHRLWPYVLCLLATLTAPASAEAVEAGGGDGAGPLQNCRTDLKLLNTVTGWQVQWPHQWAVAAATQGQMNAAFFAKWSEAPHALASDIAGLKAGLANGTAAPRSTVLKVLSEVAAFEGEMDHGQFASAEWRSDPRQRAMIGAIRPGVGQYRHFLAEDYLPHASKADGLPHSVEGRRCYDAAVREWTGIAIDPAMTEAIGWRLLHETDAELAHTAGIRPVAERALLDRLRKPDPERTTGEDLINLSQRAIRRAEAALPKWFANIEEKPLSVEPMDVLTAQSAPGGLYHPAGEDHPDASFDVNTSRPTERRLMAEVIAFHEGVPGHHLAFTAAKTSGTFNAGFAEGWAIYAEYLADQMGLYSSPQDRIGMMAKHLWAASRLIVEPGLHVHGWTRDQAIRFMLDHTALSGSEIENEVDRYISMPGQSLSYMLGYERFRAARHRVQKALGPRFSYPEFHQVLLAKGMRKFDEVDQDVDQWIAEEGRDIPQTAHARKAPRPTLLTPGQLPSQPRSPGAAKREDASSYRRSENASRNAITPITLAAT